MKNQIETRTVAVLSTAHLSYGTCLWARQQIVSDLQDPEMPLSIDLSETMHGWFMYCDDLFPQYECPDDVKAALLNIIEWAKRHDFQYIIFDLHADIVSDLPTYEWSE